MDPEFWQKRWRERQVGFHQSAPHPFLERWWPSLGVPPGARVYVPLCGKSLDMVWLAVRGYSVVGSELSAIAVEEFFGEQRHTDVKAETRGPFEVHRTGAYELLQGDALQLTPELLGPVQAAYDRAALVALPPEMRGRLRRKLRRVDAHRQSHAVGGLRICAACESRPAVLGRAG